MNTSSLFIFILVIGCLCVSCNKEVTIGSDIIEDQPIGIDFNESIDISAETVFGDPGVMYRNSVNLTRRTYLLGELDDPNFGKTSSTVFVTPRISDNVPDFTTATLDSVVMVLPYDTLGQYGDLDAIHELSVHRLQEDIDLFTIDTLLSDFCFDYDPTPIISYSFNPEPRDSTDVYSPFVDSVVTILPQIRIRLDDALWNNLLLDTLNTETTQSLVNIVKGYAIKSVPNGSNMYGINLSATSPAGIEVFYTDSIDRVFTFDLSATVQAEEESLVKHNCFQSDYSGSVVESVIGDNSSELNYMQGLQGFDVVYNLSDVLSLEDQFVNYAVLELFAEKVDGVEPLNVLIAAYRDSNNNLIRIRDITSSAGGFFNSSVQEVDVDGITVLKHEIVITNHVIDLINGAVDNTSLTILANNKNENPKHTVFYSPNHPTYPASLKLITTKP